MKKKLLIGIALIIVGIIAFKITKSITDKPIFSSSAKTKHLVVISIDSLNAQDYEQLTQLPNFKKLLDEGSHAKEVVGVYPSLTYPSHTSIITGTYPDKHGIYSNEISTPGSTNQPWRWYSKDVKVPTLYGLAEKSNMRVGSVLWPVMAGAKIDYNLPEIWTIHKKQSQILLSFKASTPLPLIEMYIRYGNKLDGQKQPWIDNFTTASSSKLIKEHKPNLFLIHLSDLDHARHRHGFMSTDAKEALKDEDTRIGKIVQATKDAGIYKSTTFIILGDHGFADVTSKISLNVAFRQNGLLTVDKNGKLTDWKAYVNNSDGSCQISLKNKNDIVVKNKVQELLNNLANDPNSGIAKVYTKEEAAEKRVTGDFEFMCEAKDGYCFNNDWNLQNVVNKIDPLDFDEYKKGFSVATHGYDPLKPNYRTFFMAAGPGIKKGVEIPSINLVDEGPTMAALLGLEMKNVDGRVLTEILN